MVWEHCQLVVTGLKRNLDTTGDGPDRDGLLINLPCQDAVVKYRWLCLGQRIVIVGILPVDGFSRRSRQMDERLYPHY